MPERQTKQHKTTWLALCQADFGLAEEVKGLHVELVWGSGGASYQNSWIVVPREALEVGRALATVRPVAVVVVVVEAESFQSFFPS